MVHAGGRWRPEQTLSAAAFVIVYMSPHTQARDSAVLRAESSLLWKE